MRGIRIGSLDGGGLVERAAARGAALAAATALVGAALAARAGEAGGCSEWRGAGKNGVISDSPPLVERLADGKVPKLWEVEMPGESAGNYSSPVGTAGRVYVHVSWSRTEPVATRTLDGGVVRAMGDLPKDLPDDLAAKVEAEMLSGERKALAPEGVKAWAAAWVAANVPEDRRKGAGRWAEGRLVRGPEAASIECLRAVAALGSRTFESQEKLDEWAASAGLSPPDAQAVSSAVRKERGYRDDALVCLALDSGREEWRREFRAADNPGQGASNTPCVARGAVLFSGCSGTVYCLDAATGEERWRAGEAARGEATDSSITVAGGVVVVQSKKGAGGLELATGREIWRDRSLAADSNSPAKWTLAGKEYVVTAGAKLSCVDPADGRVLWQVPGGKWTTPAVSGDVMAFYFPDREIAVYALGLDGAKEVARAPIKCRSCSPVTDGRRVYAFASRESVCLDAPTGEVVWKGPGHNTIYPSPLLADGRLVSNNGKSFMMFDAATGKELGLVQASFGECTSAGLVDGRLLARGKMRLVCYDLRKRAVAAK